jgi:esterase/lipase superfamily enzyme
MRRWLSGMFLVFAACSQWEASAQAQRPVIPEPCRQVQRTSIGELDHEIAAVEGRLKDRSKSGQQEAKQKQVESENAADQSKLIDLLFLRECFRRDLLDDPVLIQKSESAAGRRGPTPWVTITTYYATNRQSTGATAGVTSYGANRAADIEYGKAEVSVPTSRQPGELPLPKLWRFELAPDPSKHFILKRVEPLSGSPAHDQLKLALSASGQKSVLIFVHGFNVTFVDAALRTAQLAHDLSFNGLPMFFSWPSAGATSSYFHDEEMAQLSYKAFNQVLDDAAALGANEIYLLAHSMGSRIVANVLKDRAGQGQDASQISELLLAAPDINQEIFREQIVPPLTSMKNMRRTIYASGSDIALKASKFAHEFHRLGETTGGITTFDGYDTIDATAAAPVIRAYGHSYITDSPKVLDDIADILIRRKPVSERGLDSKEIPPDRYWLLR